MMVIGIGEFTLELWILVKSGLALFVINFYKANAFIYM